MTASEMADALDMARVRMSPQDIRQTLRQNSSGAHAVAVVLGDPNRDSGIRVAHSFNLLHDGDDVVAIDGQSDSAGRWSPETYRDDAQWHLYVPKKELAKFATADIVAATDDAPLTDGRAERNARGESARRILRGLRASVRPGVSADSAGMFGPDLFGTREAPPLADGLPFIDPKGVSTGQLGALFRAFDLAAGQTPRSDLTAAVLSDDQAGVLGNRHRVTMPWVFHAIWLDGPLPEALHTGLAERAKHLRRGGGFGRQLTSVLWTDQSRSRFESVAARDDHLSR